MIFLIFLQEKIQNTGISSETTIPGISSETTETKGTSSETTETRDLAPREAERWEGNQKLSP